MHIVHVISGLHVGGAEIMLLKLLQGLDRSRFEVTVISLADGGLISERIQDLNIKVYHLGMSSPLVAPVVLYRLFRLARILQIDVIQGWMYHGNLAATLLAKWSKGSPALYWNIRHSLADLTRETKLIQFVIRLGSRWSRGPAKVIHNSAVSIDDHARIGYARENTVMIPNGFDTAVFCPSIDSGKALRARLGLNDDVRLIGTLGRRHEMKAQGDFIRAASLLVEEFPDTHFVLAGKGVTLADEELARLASETNVAGRIHLVGAQAAPAKYLAGLDVFCLSSVYGEGFPNVLGEAMSCGVPCVATDVGEARTIVSEFGEVVPPGDPIALAAGIGRVLQMSDDGVLQLGQECRRSIGERYHIARIVGQYVGLYSAGRQ